jgi:hypothetical protein
MPNDQFLFTFAGYADTSFKIEDTPCEGDGGEPGLHRERDH